MTKDDIIEMAKEAGLVRAGDGWTEPARWGLTQIECFACLAAAAEREACALVCEDLPAPPDVPRDRATVWDVATLDCAAAIRARSQS